MVNNSTNLLPSTYERAKRVAEGYVLSMGVPLFTGSGFPFRSSPCARVRGLTDMLVDKIIIERHPSKIDIPQRSPWLPCRRRWCSLTVRSESLQEILGTKPEGTAVECGLIVIPTVGQRDPTSTE